MFENLNDPRRTQWRNSEDELLKAFVMKYGTNSWSRISCSLRYKTPNQCRERWSEYLKHTLEDTQWDPEDDLKLIRLSKVFPNQWKTIASSLGRSAQHCLTRFEYILGERNSTESSSLAASEELVSKGIVYPHTQPAVADSNTLDQDEQLALKEGYSRLANIQNRKERKQFKKVQQDISSNVKKVRKMRDMQRAGLLPRGVVANEVILDKPDTKVYLNDNQINLNSSEIHSHNPSSDKGSRSSKTNQVPTTHAKKGIQHTDFDSFDLSYEECLKAGTVFPDVHISSEGVPDHV